MKDISDIFDQVTEDDLNDDLQIIASLCGMGAVRLLLRHCQGMHFYIPKLSRLNDFVQKYVKNNGSKSLKQIAVDLKLSETYIRDIYNSH